MTKINDSIKSLVKNYRTCFRNIIPAKFSPYVRKLKMLFNWKILRKKISRNQWLDTTKLGKYEFLMSASLEELKTDAYPYFKRLEFIIAHVEGKVLEIGCGVGNITRWISKSEKVTQVVAIDAFPEAIRKLKSYKFSKVIPKRMRLECLEFELGTEFDTVVISEVIEHIYPDEEKKLLAKLEKYTHRETAFLISAPIGWLNDPFHVRGFSKKRFRDHLTKHYGDAREIDYSSGYSQIAYGILDYGHKKVLGVINYEPITAYLQKGFSPSQLISYYNPADYFDQVHIFACRDTEWRLSNKIQVHKLHSGFKAVIQLAFHLLRYKVNILRNYGAFKTLYLTAEVKYILQLPAIVSLHDRYYPKAILAYDYIFTYVEWLREKIIAHYKYPRVTLLLNRIDETLFKPGPYPNVRQDFSKSTHRIVSIGRLIDYGKNQTTLIEAMAKVVEAYPDTLLLLIGEGADKEKFQKLIKELDLTENIHLLGAQSQEMVVEYLNWSHFHILINNSGDLGKSLTESLVVGKPVVATGGKGNSRNHLIEDFNAKLVNFRDIYDSQSVASVLLDMIRDIDNFDSEKIRAHAIKDYSFNQLSNLEANLYAKTYKTFQRQLTSFIFPLLRGKPALWKVLRPFQGLLITLIAYPLQILLTFSRIVKLRKIKPKNN